MTKGALPILIKLACLQLDSGAADAKDQRVARVVERIHQLQPVDLIVLPELWPVTYFQFDRYETEAESLQGPTVTAIRHAAVSRGCFILGGSIVERSGDGKLHNTSFLIGPDGRTHLTYRKIHVFGYRSKESALLTPGATVDVAETPLGAVAVTTCYDLRFPELYRLLVDRGAQIIIVPAAWPQARLEHWRLLTRARALENQVYLVACNMAGVDAGTRLAGHSVVVDPWGDVIGEAGDEEQVLYAELDLARLRQIRDEFPVLKDRRLMSPHV